MLLRDHMAATGGWLFRKRSFVLLIFVPFIIFSVFQGERVEAWSGEGIGDIYEVFSLFLVLLGETLRILTVGFVPVGTSGRNTTRQIADTLNTTGLYSLTRNPLYLGNCLMYVGIALYTQNILLALVLALVLALYYERIISAEESFLAPKFGQPYTDWAAQTPAFFPRLSGFVAPTMSFSIRSVLRREHASVFGAFTILYLIEVGLHYLAAGPEPIEPIWHWLFALAVIGEGTIVWLKRRTTLLSVEGR